MTTRYIPSPLEGRRGQMAPRVKAAGAPSFHVTVYFNPEAAPEAIENLKAFPWSASWTMRRALDFYVRYHAFPEDQVPSKRQRTCGHVECGRTFVPHHKAHYFCSDHCKKVGYGAWLSNRRNNPSKELPEEDFEPAAEPPEETPMPKQVVNGRAPEPILPNLSMADLDSVDTDLLELYLSARRQEVEFTRAVEAAQKALEEARSQLIEAQENLREARQAISKDLAGPEGGRRKGL